MAGRTFRKTRLDVGGNQGGTIVFEDPSKPATPIIQREVDGNPDADRIRFEPIEDAESSSVNTDGFPIDPDSIPDADENAGQQRTRRRRSDAGQARGQRRKERGTFAQSSNLEKLMLSMHLMAATFLKVPELRIDAEESAILTKATLDVCKAYGMPDLSEKQVAMANAVMAVGTVYGPRMVIILSRKNGKPKLMQFPSTHAVQQAQPITPQQPAQQADTTIVGAVPQKPPTNSSVESGFISSSMFAPDTDSLEAINVS